MADLRSGSKGLTDKRLNSRSVPAWPVPPPRKVHKCIPKELQDFVRPYATDAISFYNDSTGAKYKLVEPGDISQVRRATYVLYHIDFMAKKTDVADAPEEMFFAEMTSTNNVRCVKFCKCMGQKNSISGDKNNGCCYCRFYNVQHPRGGGFMAGRAGLFTDEANYRHY
ncbi:hypothetical protein MKW92_012875 [Papaver armeniacum]|nr:hypothetical protein MKW92_012875 [Papaver armeniacum]